MSDYEYNYRLDQTYEVRESLDRGFSGFSTLDQAGIDVRSQFPGWNTERELGDLSQEALPPRRPVQPPSGEVDASRSDLRYESTSLGEELVRALARGSKVEEDQVPDYVPPPASFSDDASEVAEEAPATVSGADKVATRKWTREERQRTSEEDRLPRGPLRPSTASRDRFERHGIPGGDHSEIRRPSPGYPEERYPYARQEASAQWSLGPMGASRVEDRPRPRVSFQEQDQLAEALKALALSIDNQNKPKDVHPKATFAGLEHENPRDFLNELDDWFHCHQVRDNRDKLQHAGQRLVGQAAAWYAPQKAYLRTYWEFADKIMKRFDGFERQMDLKMELMSRTQRDGESVESFILKKRALFFRLHPEGSEADLIRLVLNLLDTELRSRLRAAHLQDVDTLIQLAVELESDVKELRARHRRQQQPQLPPQRPQYQEVQRQTPRPLQPTPRRFEQAPQLPTKPRNLAPPPQRPTEQVKAPQQQPSRQQQPTGEPRKSSSNACFRCGGPHWMRDCPKAPQPTTVKGPQQTQTKTDKGPTVASVHPTTVPAARDAPKKAEAKAKGKKGAEAKKSDKTGAGTGQDF